MYAEVKCLLKIINHDILIYTYYVVSRTWRVLIILHFLINLLFKIGDTVTFVK